MCVRAPTSLHLQHHYPCTPSRSDSKCSLSGNTPLMEQSSPSSGSGSGVEWCGVGGGYRRLGGGGGGVMRRLRGLGGMSHFEDEDDSTPLVAETPTTPTASIPNCLTSGGYINEASSDAEQRARILKNDSRTTAPTIPDTLPLRNDADKKVHSKHCTSSHSCSGSSSGSGNNNRVPSVPVTGIPSAPHNAWNSYLDPEPDLRYEPWFHAGIPREVAEEALSTLRAGAFLVRGASRGGLALSVRAPLLQSNSPSRPPVQHYLIHRTPRGYRIKGFTKDFPTLKALVTHHSVMPELLPCPLWLERPATARRDHADLERVTADTEYRRNHLKFSCQLDV